MAIPSQWLLPALPDAPSTRQKLFAWYLTAVLIDLVVLNLFVEYSKYVVVDSFTVSLLTALLLQLLLKLTIAAERQVAAFFKARQGVLAKFMRFFCAWLMLSGSKFVILESIDFAFGCTAPGSLDTGES